MVQEAAPAAGRNDDTPYVPEGGQMVRAAGGQLVPLADPGRERRCRHEQSTANPTCPDVTDQLRM